MRTHLALKTSVAVLLLVACGGSPLRRRHTASLRATRWGSRRRGSTPAEVVVQTAPCRTGGSRAAPPAPSTSGFAATALERRR